MLEVPTHQNIDALDGCGCNMSSILQVGSANHSCREILSGEFRGSRIGLHLFPHLFGHSLKNLSDFGRSLLKLSQGEIREHENVQPRTETIEELSRIGAELLIETASDYRGVGIDPSPHRLLLYSRNRRAGGAPVAPRHVCLAKAGVRAQMLCR